MVILGLTILIVASSCGGANEAPTSGPTDQARVAGAEVVAKDFAFEPGTVEVSNGSELKLLNKGYAFHNIKVEGEADLLIPDVDSGGEESATVDLEPGMYLIFCTVGDHRSQGMEGRLVVR